MPMHALPASITRRISALTAMLAPERELLRRRIRPGSPSRLIVTVIGCCRQDSASDVFVTTAVRDWLTYSHSTREALEVIAYCGSSTPAPPALVFRNAQLGNRSAPRWLLRRHFRITELFLVEVASRRVYEGQGHAWHHHLATDPTTRRTHADTAARLHEQALGDDEIRADLDAIREALGSRPMLLLAHLCTMTEGTRSSLRDLLTQWSGSRGVAFLDPGIELDLAAHPDFLVDEPEQAHLTPAGHRAYGDMLERWSSRR